MVNKDILKQIKLVIADCDGTLTDGGLYFSKDGCQFKKFNVKDGMAVNLLKIHSIKTAIITGCNSKITIKRVKELNIDDVYIDIKNKLDVINKLRKKYNLGFSEIAYMGDDINDLEAIKSVGFGCCVNDAVDEVKEISMYITKLNGGDGAFREITDLILKYK